MINYFTVVNDKNLSAMAADKLYQLMQDSDLSPAELVDQISIAADDVVLQAASDVLLDNPAEVDRYKAGETKLMGFFIGQVMARTGGEAEAAAVQRVLADLLTK